MDAELLLVWFLFKFLLFDARNGKTAQYISRNRLAWLKTFWLSQASSFLAVNRQASWDHPKVALIVLKQQTNAWTKYERKKNSNLCFRKGAVFSTRFLGYVLFLFCVPVLIVFGMEHPENRYLWMLSYFLLGSYSSFCFLKPAIFKKAHIYYKLDLTGIRLFDFLKLVLFWL